MRNYLELGSWNVICDRCGLKKKNHMLKTEWTGLRVCEECWEARHPADLIRIKPETHVPTWTRPEPPVVFMTNEDVWTDEYGNAIETELEIALWTAVEDDWSDNAGVYIFDDEDTTYQPPRPGPIFTE